MRALSFFILMTLLGCASAPRKDEPWTLARAVAQQGARRELLQRISGKLSFRYQGKGKGQSFGGSGRIVTDGKKRLLELRDPMGRVRYSLTVDESGVLAYYQSEGKAYEAEDGGRKYFQRFFGIDVTGQEFLDFLVGLAPASWSLTSVSSTPAPSTVLYENPLAAKTSAGASVFFSSKNGEVERVWWPTKKGNFEALYRDYEPCCSLNGSEATLAHVLDIKLPKTGEAIEIEWETLDRLSTAPNPEWFLRKLSPGTKKSPIP